MPDTTAAAQSVNRRLVLPLAGMLVVVLAVVSMAVFAGGSQAREVEWPIQLRYKITYYAQGQLLGAEVHEFRGSDWRNWTDVVVALEGSGDYGALRGEIHRLSGDVHFLGWLREPPREGADGFLDDSVYADFPDNAVQVDATPAGGEKMSPNSFFNGGFGHMVPPRDHVESQPGSPAAQDRVANRLGLATGDTASSRRVIAACEQGTVAGCGRTGDNVIVDVVFHKEVGVPLEVHEQAPDGKSTLMEVFSIR